MLGLNLLSPTGIFQVAMTRHLAVGVSLFQLNTDVNSVSTSAMGLGASMNFYMDEPFIGVWLQVGTSIMRTNIMFNGTEGNALASTLFGTLGWRWKWSETFNSGFAFGGQFYYMKKNDVVLFDHTFILPVIFLNAGISF